MKVKAKSANHSLLIQNKFFLTGIAPLSATSLYSTAPVTSATSPKRTFNHSFLLYHNTLNIDYSGWLGDMSSRTILLFSFSPKLNNDEGRNVQNKVVSPAWQSRACYNKILNIDGETWQTGIYIGFAQTLLENINSIQTLLANINNVQTLLANINNVRTLLANIHKVQTLLANISNVQTLLANIHNVQTLLANISNVQI